MWIVVPAIMQSFGLPQSSQVDYFKNVQIKKLQLKINNL
jgi:hypothetical protein